MQTQNNKPPHTLNFGTFGLYRYILACMVVITHTAPKNWRFAGEHAVFAFFILSGYVVSFILTQNYLRQRRGIVKYAINRALRIFPLYWLVSLAALAVIIYYPSYAWQIDPSFALPNNAISWVQNIVVIGLEYAYSGVMDPKSLLPVGWSLSNEMIFWSIIPIVLIVPRLQKWLFAYALAYTAYAIYITWPLSLWQGMAYRYFSPQAAALPFSIGYYIFIRKLRGQAPVPVFVGIAAIVAFIVMLCAAPYIFESPRFTGFYISLIINTLITAFLSCIDPHSLPQRLRSLDYFLGNLSYPMYLIHMSVGALCLALIPSLTAHSVPLCIVAIVCSTLLAIALHITVETPINRWKKTYKQRTL